MRIVNSFGSGITVKRGHFDEQIQGDRPHPAIALPSPLSLNKMNNNDVADQIIQERASLKHLRVLLNGMSWIQKIAVAQIACNQIGSKEHIQLIKLHPFGEQFDDQLQAAIILMGSLPPDTLAEIAIEILEEPHDRNE
ncbi:hypothetical protein QUB29_26415 [Microcoleus sp. B4b_D2]|uniref:hypothetical protein n=1 Tax=Microcoleus sp. B4b_D2 TaxID=3055310 RepID=UPI002FD52739